MTDEHTGPGPDEEEGRPDDTEPRLFAFSEPASPSIAAEPPEPEEPESRDAVEAPPVPPPPASEQPPRPSYPPATPPPAEPPPTRLQPVVEPPRVESAPMEATRAEAPVAERPASPRPAAGRPPRRVYRRRATVRKVDPWSVLKLSLVFYFCALLVVMMGLFLFWSVIYRIGLMDRLLGFLADLQLVVTIDGGMIARAVFLVGLLNVVLWSGINVFLAFLYNLIADLIGGLKVTLAEEE